MLRQATAQTLRTPRHGHARTHTHTVKMFLFRRFRLPTPPPPPHSPAAVLHERQSRLPEEWPTHKRCIFQYKVSKRFNDPKLSSPPPPPLAGEFRYTKNTGCSLDACIGILFCSELALFRWSPQRIHRVCSSTDRGFSWICLNILSTNSVPMKNK